MNLSLGRTHLMMAVLAVAMLLAPYTTFGILNIWDTPQGLPDIDNRVGALLPTDAQLSRVSALGARADWNRFGTINTLIKDGGYISTGLTGEPIAAAREWVRANRELFKLSEQGVADLQLVNDGRMPYNNAHFVLFRQSFGGTVPTKDGQISVSIVGGKIFHVWSSSAGDQSAPGAATLTPLQGWLAAATNVGRAVPVGNVTNVAADANNNWTLLQVIGFPQIQQVRLTALPTPNSGVRPAYEANVVYNVGHINEAYTVFVDAQTGDILQRSNRVNFLNPPPETTTFTGQYDGKVFPCAGTAHNFTVPTGKTRIAVQVTAAVASNDLKVHLLFNGLQVAEEDTGVSSEALNYAPNGGVPAGAYTVKICSTPNTMDVPQTPPFSYVGNFVTDDAATPAAGAPYPPKWKYFQANPDLSYSNTDTSKTGCWETSTGFPGTPVPGCDLTRPEKNIAARAPWDYDFNAGTFTGTTRGNAAQTAESWGSPLTPSSPYTPTSATREYKFPFTNHWNRSKCDPTTLKHTGGVDDDADIDESINQLFVTHNRFHDYSYFLGFTESNYNLQTDNFGNTEASRENDPEIGNVQAGAVSGGANGMYLGRDNANQIALQDGVPGITNQYLFQPIGGAFYSPCADGDLDVGIVGHEYTHAISNRMIGGPDESIGGQQGSSMGESWSDLDAAEYLNSYGYVPTNDESPAAIGIYATGNKQLAIRDYANAPNPLNYSDFGFDTPGPEVHADGEIWNAVNWNVRQVLIDKYNAAYPYTDRARQIACADGKFNPENCPGNRRWVQLMFDAFLLQPASTSMLNARDAMMAADVARFNGANQVELWRVFGQRGFGQLANSNGSGDTTPIPDFSSPLEPNAVVTFNVLAKDESNAVITGAKVFVGNYEARSRPIADMDPATTVDASNPRTNINDNTAKFVAGTYDFVVYAPGYGAHRFTQTFAAGATKTVTFVLPTNRASISKGASVTTTATDAADIAAKNNLIDDTESTGARLGTVRPINDDTMTVDLQGTTPVNVTSINVSTAAGPNNPGRFTGIRKFEVLACSNGTCLLPTDFTVVYTSPDDAFPSQAPRPVQPQLIMRKFDLPPTMATHLKLHVLTTQCTGNASFLGEQDNDPFNNTDCSTVVPATSPGPPPTTPLQPGSISRATEFQVFTSAASVVIPGIESDVSPRPDGDGAVSSTDVSTVQGFQLGLGLPYQGNEFQRADSAPFPTRGDGRITSIDVSQAQAYQLGLNLTDNGTLQPAAGPTGPNAFAAPASLFSTGKSAGKLFELNSSGYISPAAVAAPREVRLVNTNGSVGRNVTVPINVNSMGDESVYGFSLNYDSTKLSNPIVTIGTSGGSVASNPMQAGRIGVSVSFGGGTIAAGSNLNLVNVRFTIAAGAATGQTPITFGDSPTFREVASAPGAPGGVQALPTTFTDGTLTINAPTAAVVAVSGRVLTPTRKGLTNATVSLTDANGNARELRTGANGYYRFENVTVGEVYILDVRSKRYQFAPQVINVTEDTNGLNLTSQEGSSKNWRK